MGSKLPDYQAVHGEGHYLRNPQTLALMRSGYEYPALADRSTPEEWMSAGSPDIRQQARQPVKSILSSHYPDYIDPAIDAKIRERFPMPRVIYSFNLYCSCYQHRPDCNRV